MHNIRNLSDLPQDEQEKLGREIIAYLTDLLCQSLWPDTALSPVRPAAQPPVIQSLPLAIRPEVN